MGQRHQIFSITNQGSYAWHNQWCYGRMPIRQLELVLKYEKNNGRPDKDGWGGYGSLTNSHSDMINVQRAIELIMNVDVDFGSIHNNYDITEELTVKPATEKKPAELDCLGGDNNDGITIIDTRKYPLKYAFLFFPWDEMAEDDMRPLTASQYFKRYEEDYAEGGGHSGLLEDARASIEYVEQHAKLLTLNQLANIFPTSMKSVMEERRRIQQTKFEDLPTLINEQIKYPVNKELFQQRFKKAA